MEAITSKVNIEVNMEWNIRRPRPPSALRLGSALVRGIRLAS